MRNYWKEGDDVDSVAWAVVIQWSCGSLRPEGGSPEHTIFLSLCVCSE